MDNHEDIAPGPVIHSHMDWWEDACDIETDQTAEASCYGASGIEAEEWWQRIRVRSAEDIAAEQAEWAEEQGRREAESRDRRQAEAAEEKHRRRDRIDRKMAHINARGDQFDDGVDTLPIHKAHEDLLRLKALCRDGQATLHFYKSILPEEYFTGTLDWLQDLSEWAQARFLQAFDRDNV